MPWNSNNSTTTSKQPTGIQTVTPASTIIYLKTVQAWNLTARFKGKPHCPNWLRTKIRIDLNSTREYSNNSLKRWTKPTTRPITSLRCRMTTSKNNLTRAYRHSSSIQLIFRQQYLPCRISRIWAQVRWELRAEIKLDKAQLAITDW